MDFIIRRPGRNSVLLQKFAEMSWVQNVCSVDVWVTERITCSIKDKMQTEEKIM
jgi:hypothetical protein